MKYRRLGKTNLKVSVVGIGTWQYGGEWGKNFDEGEVKKILDRGFYLGFNFIDTAECYGDHLSERLIGKAVKEKRKEWIIATKFGHKFISHLNRETVWDVAGVKKQLEDSLRALQTDYIDLYQFHSGNDEVFNNEELWLMLQNEVKAGKIRHLGISISNKDGINSLEQTKSASKVGAEVIEAVYNRLEKYPEEEIFPACIEQDLGVLARVPLASGLLSGKYKKGTVFSDNDVRASKDHKQIDLQLEEIEEIMKNEVPAGVNMAEWAIAWSLKHDAVSTCIPGFKNIEQLESGAKAADLDMVSAEHPQAWK